MGHTQIKAIFLCRNNERRSQAFRNVLFYQNIMFWLSYECFYFLCDIFLVRKGHFKPRRLWLARLVRGFPQFYHQLY